MDYNLEQAKIDTLEAKGFLTSDYNNFNKLTTIGEGNGSFAHVKKYKNIAIRNESMSHSSSHNKFAKDILMKFYENKIIKSEHAMNSDVAFAPTIDYALRMKKEYVRSHYEFMPLIDGITMDKDVNLDHISKLSPDAIQKYFRDWNELMRVALSVDYVKLTNFILTNNAINFIDLDNMYSKHLPLQRSEPTEKSLLNAAFLLLNKPYVRHRLSEAEHNRTEIAYKYRELNSRIQNALNSKQFKNENERALSYAKSMDIPLIMKGTEVYGL